LNSMYCNFHIFQIIIIENIDKIIKGALEVFLSVYIIVVRNKTTTYFPLKTDKSLFCHRDNPTIHYGYCVSNAVYFAKKNDVLPTILSTELRGRYNRFLH